MYDAAPVPTFTIHEVEFDPGTIEFAIRRIEAFSVPVLRNGLNRHQADFYHIIWITGFTGEGKIWIDLDCYPVKPHMMCFVSPGQIRAWDVPALGTAGAVTGYAIAFTQGFFSDSPDDANALIQLPQFYSVGAAPVLHVDEDQARRFTQAYHGPAGRQDHPRAPAAGSQAPAPLLPLPGRRDRRSPQFRRPLLFQPLLQEACRRLPDGIPRTTIKSPWTGRRSS